MARLAARGHVYETSKSFVNVWVENEPENLIFRWREAISNQDFLKKANLAEPQPILEISQKMEDWLLAMHEMPLPFFLEKILNQSGLLGWAMSLPDRIFHFSAINTLLEFVKKESLRHPRGYSLDRFLDQLDTLDANRLPISMQRHIRMTNHQITKSPNHPVNLLTAHGSKGMEFSHVFLIGCNEENWENKKNTRSGRFSLPDNLTFSEVEDETESLRRLFYVATTRAKTHLQISFSRKNLEGKTQLPSQFLGETGLEILEKMPDTATLFEAQSLLLLDPPRPTVTLPEGAVLDDLLEKFVLSPTSFNRYLRCPLAFYYQDVLCVPDFSSENAAFGQAMHRALQLYFLQMKKTPGREFPPENILTADFEKEMDTRRAFFGSENFRQMMALGKSILPKYRAEKMSGWRKNSEVERRIGLVEMSGVPLTGVIDRFEKLENSQIRVVDYKTGGFRKEKTEPPSEKLPHGGDYRRQLFFYKILLEAFVPSPGQVISGVISYLEPENSGHFRDVEIEFSPSELDFVKKLIIETDAKIRRREFSEGCGEADCSWCRLHRENEFPEKLENREEGLDDF